MFSNTEKTANPVCSMKRPNEKPTFAEAREIWRADVSDAKPPHRSVIDRALATRLDTSVRSSDSISPWDIVWGFAASVALSMLVTVFLRHGALSQSSDSNFLQPFLTAPIEDLTHG
jgi:hypothetical protein